MSHWLHQSVNGFAGSSYCECIWQGELRDTRFQKMAIYFGGMQACFVEFHLDFLFLNSRMFLKNDLSTHQIIQLQQKTTKRIKSAYKTEETHSTQLNSLLCVFIHSFNSTTKFQAAFFHLKQPQNRHP